MRLTKEKTERNRQAILDAASRLFRARGYDAVGLSEVMGEAGFTCGGFYNHFASKEALAAEVCRCTFAQETRGLARRLEASPRSSVTRMIDAFLSPEHRDDAARGCPSVSLVADAAHHGAEMQAAFAQGIETYIHTLADALSTPDAATGEPVRGDADRRTLATALVAQMVGSLALSRAVGEASTGLSEELLVAGRGATMRLRMAPARKKKRR